MKLKLPTLFLLSLLTAILLFLVVRGKAAEVKAEGIEAAYCAAILAQVEQVAGCKVEGDITVVVEDRITSGFGGVMPYGMPVYGLYEQDRRRVSVVREALCPWLLAHEMAHVVYLDRFPFHPESWADTTANLAVGPEPRWLRPDKD